MKQKAIICDIDGVLLDTEHIFDEITFLNLSGNAKWGYFCRHANRHDVVADSRIIEILEAFAQKGFRIIFLSARAQKIEAQTKIKIDTAIRQFAQKDFPYLLILRPNGNFDSSDKVKARWLNLLREKYDIYAAIDDDPTNCAMFAENKILTLQTKER